MPSTFLVVPQWQGSGSSRAMRLVDGAEAIRGDLPSASTVTVDVPLGAGSNEGTLVHRLSSIDQVRGSMAKALKKLHGPIITIGGDCGVELAAVQHARASQEPMAMIWLDAHPDLNTPESSPSGAFTGMVLRTLLGDGAEALLPASPLDPAHTIVAGVRSVDEGESEYLATSGVRVFTSQDVDAQSVTAALAASSARSVYIHVDLDVLDPAEFDGVSDPVPFGLPLATVLEVIAAVKATLPLAGAGIAGFAPASPDAVSDGMGSILRIVGALTA